MKPAETPQFDIPDAVRFGVAKKRNEGGIFELTEEISSGASTGMDQNPDKTDITPKVGKLSESAYTPFGKGSASSSYLSRSSSDTGREGTNSAFDLQWPPWKENLWQSCQGG